MRMTSKQKTLRLVQISILAALIIVLQFLGSLISGATGLPMSFVLIPIVVGALVIGPKAGGLLGLVFGIMTIIMGFTGLDAFTSILFNNFGTWKMIVCVILCVVKATLAGLCSGWVYRLLNKFFNGKNVTLTTVLASVTAPIVNTGIFVIGMLLFFFNDMGAIQSLLQVPAEGFMGSAKFIFIGLAGMNFIMEFAINLIISPAIVRIVDVVKKKLK
ncbi:MAG: ECF transporter S component [Ruminococcaceae bacterium]|nr:ECF transporter S component [Oscillospiraceae bacterium]